jgi:parvulin-like peptidyl-prolyl isomerase
MARRSLLALFALLAVLAALTAAGCGGSDEGVSSDSVAVVDGEQISRASFEGLITQAKKSFAQQKRAFPKAGTAERKQLNDQAVQYLVQREEFAQEAESQNLEVTDAAVNKRLDQIKKQYFGGDQKKYEKQLKDQGLTDASVRADIRAQIVSEKLFNHVTKDIKVTDANVKKYYDQNKSSYGTPEQRDVRHILIAEKKKSGQVDYAKSKTLADRIYNQLKAGGDFTALAKKYSEDPGSKDNGGKLTISKGQTVAPFDQTAFLLEKGQISRPVKTEYGYHIIEPLSAVKPAKTQPLDKNLKDQIRQQLLTTKRNTAMTKWASDLEKEYKDKIEYATGFAPAASASGGATTTG